MLNTFKNEPNVFVLKLTYNTPPRKRFFSPTPKVKVISPTLLTSVPGNTG